MEPLESPVMPAEATVETLAVAATSQQPGCLVKTPGVVAEAASILLSGSGSAAPGCGEPFSGFASGGIHPSGGTT